MAAKSLDQCAALVTGGTSGIGLASAKALVGAGVRRIAINGRDRARGERAAAALAAIAPGTEIMLARADVVDATASRAMVDDVATRLGGLDILVNCTGGADLPALFHTYDPVTFPTIVTRRLCGAMNCCHAAVPHLRQAGGGAIINTASDAAKTATPGETVIGAMMAAIVMFSRALALEVSRHGIRVNVMTPSIVQNTEQYAKLMADPFCAKLFGKAEARARLGVVQPEDLGALVVFLASPAAARMTGQTMSVTGGISAA